MPSRGRSHRLHGLTADRVHHLLSDIECGLFYLADWADAVTDIREQFPLERDATQRIGAQIGIAHPLDTATRTPLVMTTDFLIDVIQDGRMMLMARAVKPAAELDKPRVLEKLEIERRYWQEQGVDWGIVTEKDIPPVAVSIGRSARECRAERFSEPLVAFFIIPHRNLDEALGIYDAALAVNLKPKEGATALLRDIKAGDRSVMVATEGPNDAQETTISRLGIAPYVDLLVTSSMEGFTKSNGGATCKIPAAR